MDVIEPIESTEPIESVEPIGSIESIQPVTDQPTIDRPIIDQSVADQPTIERVGSTARRPICEQSASSRASSHCEQSLLGRNGARNDCSQQFNRELKEENIDDDCASSIVLRTQDRLAADFDLRLDAIWASEADDTAQAASDPVDCVTAVSNSNAGSVDCTTASGNSTNGMSSNECSQSCNDRNSAMKGQIDDDLSGGK